MACTTKRCSASEGWAERLEQRNHANALRPTMPGGLPQGQWSPGSIENDVKSWLHAHISTWPCQYVTDPRATR